MSNFEYPSLIFLLSSLGLLFLFAFIKFMYGSWWIPIYIQKKMRQQGINVISYSFPYGNSKEINKMRMEAISRPMDLSSHNILPRLQPHIYLWLNIYGENFVNWNGSQADFVVTEVGLVKEIMNNKGEYPKTLTGIAKTLLGDGLATCNDAQKWAKQRKLANYAFHADSLKSMSETFIASTELMLERWKQYEGKEMEVCEEFARLTSDIISRTAFGSSYAEGIDIFQNLTKYCFLVSKSSQLKIPGLSRFYKTNVETEADKLEQEIRKSIARIIEKREKATTSGKSASFGTDFLGLLMQAMNDPDENNRITIEDVVDECKTFYIAGHETTSSLLGWIALLLGIYTDWQEKARQEVINVFGHDNPHSDGLPKLKTMSMIMNETLRLYNPANFLFRRVLAEKTRLGKFILPANVRITIPTLAIHQDTEIWGDDAHLFKPERFCQGVAKATKNNVSAFIPFGLGPRNCVGSSFATNEVKIVLSMILQRYSFTISPTYIHSPVQHFTVRAQHGIQVKLHRLEAGKIHV